MSGASYPDSTDLDGEGIDQSPGADMEVVTDGGALQIASASTDQVEFSGSSGTLTLDNAISFSGEIIGLAGQDTLDLSDISYGPNTTATYLGTTSGGVLTVSDGANTANISLQGDYLSSTWTLSADGNGGTNVVDPQVASNWQELDVGGGGYITGIDVAPNGVEVIRTDTYGAYIWNGTKWQQLVNASSMPASFMNNASDLSNASQGVYEIQVAASNSNILYMMFEGYIFESSNDGTTWNQTSFAQVTTNPNDGYRYNGQKMAIDPNNSNTVVVGTPENGLFITYNGGTTWQSVASVPGSTSDGSGNYPGITGILFDPALGVTNGNTNTIFAASYGNGVYESTNDGVSWSSIGGPTSVSYAAVSSTGVYYVVGNNDSIWSYANNAWTELASISGLQTVAVNPLNPQEIVAQSTAGVLDVSYDGGATWSGYNWSYSLSSTDVPWLQTTGSYMSIGGTVFNPLVPNQLIASDGVGVWNTPLATTASALGSSSIVWTDNSAGIEQLVANEIIVPPGGDPVLASWDRPFFYISDPNTYPSSYAYDGGSFAAGWSLDYASSDPSFVVGIADWWGTEESGYSTDGGQTWTPFASFIPGAGSTDVGGTIAASTPDNIIWAPADGNQPYYTLNGGQTWEAINLPGVSSWSGFDWAYYLEARDVTADRVLPNTFYLYFGGVGLFESTNGGVNWTEIHGPITVDDVYNLEIESVPGEAGNLFFTPGAQGQGPDNIGFYRSTDQGNTWTAVANVEQVNVFGFGAAAPGQNYPSIYIVGYVNNVFGIWQSTNNAQSWTQIGTYPDNTLANITTISGDPNHFGEVYVGFGGDGYAYLPGGPVVSAVAASPSAGTEVVGNTISLTLTMSEAVTVTGTPTLSLNDGGTATYTGGSGTDALTFSYTVSGSDTSVAALAITQANEPNSATVVDASGNAADLTGAITTLTGVQIVAQSLAAINAIAETPSTGDLNVGKTVTFAVSFSGNVTVANGTPTLTLNDGGTATYSTGSGTSTLSFTYSVTAGQTTNDLSVTAVNLDSATITSSGSAASLSLTGIVQSGPQIDTTAPTVTSVATSGSGITAGSGDLDAGKTVTFTVNFSEQVNVSGGTPALALSDGGAANYVSGTGSTALTFSYTVLAGQTSSDLTVTGVTLNSASITDTAGNVANLSGATTNPTGTLQIDTTAPTVTSVATSGSGITAGSGDLDAGKTVTFTVNFSEQVNVSGGTPALALSDGGTANYVSGTGSTALTFSYTVLAGQTSSDLTVTGVTLNSASITDTAGNVANLSGATTNPTGTLQIDTTAPTVTSVATSGSGITAGSGDLDAGKTVTFTVNFSEQVNVSGGTPALALSDGGAANYVSGTGSTALTFSYTVLAGQTSSDLTVTGVTLNSASITDTAGNVANLSGATTNPTGTLQIDTTAPTVTSVATSGSGITAGAGDLDAGKTVTFTVNFSEQVNVSGGTPALALSDGGTANYVSGTGSTALTFSYTVLAGQTSSDLTVTGVTLNSASITDTAGNVANLSGATTNPTGTLQIDTTAPTVTSVATSGSGITAGAGDLDAGKTVTFTVNFSEQVNVSGGTPALALSDGGTANYVSGTGSTALTFSYTVLAGQTSSDLTVTGVTLNSASITDTAGNVANLSGATTNPTGTLQIDTTAPTVTSVATSGSGITAGAGDLDAGKTVTFTVNFSEQVNVSGGTPALALSDGGAANYVSGTGSTALTFSYTVLAGQTSSDLTVTGVTLNSASITDTAGNVANLSGATANPTGTLQIDTTAPAAPVIAADNINVDNTVTLTGSTEAKSTVNIYDNGVALGTVTATAGGAWSFTTGGLGLGSQAFDATATDAAGNVSSASSVVDPVIVSNNSVVIPSGTTANSTTVSGETQYDFGTATNTTFNGNSIQFIEAGGTASKTTISVGTQYNFGTATNTTVNGNSWQYIEAGGTANGTTLFFGFQDDFGTASGTTVGANSAQVIEVNGTASNTTVISGTQYNFGTATNTTVSGNSFQYIEAGGTASGTTLFFGFQDDAGTASNTTIGANSAQLIEADGTASNTTVSLGTQYDFGTATNTTVNANSFQYVEAGGTASGATLFFGFQIDAGSASNTTIGTNSAQLIEADGTASNTTVSLGTQYDFGTATNTTVNANSFQYVEAGGTASGATLYFGFQIDSGTAINTAIGTNSAQLIAANGTASDTTVSLGTQYDFGTATNTAVNANSFQYVEAGGTASGTTVSGGTQYDFGTATNTTIENGGDEIVESGGTLSGTVTFEGSGQLTLDQSTNINNFQLVGFSTPSQKLDLADIRYGAQTTFAFSEANNDTSGTLTVSDGTRTAAITLMGNYLNSTFTLSNDGHGGTLIVDPPLTQSTGAGGLQPQPDGSDLTNNSITSAAQLIQSAAAFAAVSAGDTTGNTPVVFNNPQAMIANPLH